MQRRSCASNWWAFLNHAAQAPLLHPSTCNLLAICQMKTNGMCPSDRRTGYQFCNILLCRVTLASRAVKALIPDHALAVACASYLHNGLQDPAFCNINAFGAELLSSEISKLAVSSLFLQGSTHVRPITIVQGYRVGTVEHKFSTPSRAPPCDTDL